MIRLHESRKWHRGARSDVRQRCPRTARRLRAHAVLRELASALPRAIEGLSPQQLRQPEQPGKQVVDPSDPAASRGLGRFVGLEG